MAVAIVNGAAGTILVKAGGGKLYDAVGIAAGTSYTFIAKDGPDPSGNYRTLMGAAPVAVVAGQHLLVDGLPISFRDGLSFTVAGTPGEFDVHYD
jgi:hypothetical protein